MISEITKVLVFVGLCTASLPDGISLKHFIFSRFKLANSYIINNAMKAHYIHVHTV